MRAKVRAGGRFHFWAYRGDPSKAGARLLWEDVCDNLVLTGGLDDVLDVYLLSGTQRTSWFIGLTDGTPTIVAGNTLASHAGWVEVTAYTGNRQGYVGVRTAEVVSNVASRASFPITSDGTVMGGAFLASVASGSSGVMLCAAAFSTGDKTLNNGDFLLVQYEFGLADDGV
jgi:hypothetical protein